MTASETSRAPCASANTSGAPESCQPRSSTEARVSVAGPVTVTGSVASPRLWSPADPALYTVEASLTGVPPDRVVARFGFREFTARDGQFFLNGQPFYMRGALDQDFYADSIYSTPDKAFVVDMMRKGRTLGLNLLRCHIKVCDPDVSRRRRRSGHARVVRGAELGSVDARLRSSAAARRSTTWSRATGTIRRSSSRV